MSRNNKNGWKYKKLGDENYFKVIMGQSPPSKTYNFEEIGLPFFQGKAEFGKMFPMPKKYCSEPTRIAEKNDVLISVRAPVGPTNLANTRCCIGRGLAAIRCEQKVLPRFLFYTLRSIEGDIANSVCDQGGGFTAIKKSQLKAVEVPVPPLDEQRRIVVRIEELTRRAEEARMLRQEASQEIANLFQIELDRFFSPLQMDDWIKYEGRQVFDIVRGQVDPKEKSYIDLPHVAPNFIESGTGRLLKNQVKTPRELRLKSGKYHFNPCHVLYSKIRPNLRKATLPDFEGTCSADMYPLIPNTEVVIREFLVLALLAPPFTRYAVENSDRNAMPKINRPTMLGCRMKLPSIEAQQEFVSRVKQIQTKADKIIALQNKAVSEIEQFQPALIAKAFRGEL